MLGTFQKMKMINTRYITYIAVLTAMEVVLSRFLSINAWNLKIGFNFVPIVIAAMLMGPVAAGITAALGDFAGAMLFPIGAYFPGFTATAFLSGIVFGLFLYPSEQGGRIDHSAWNNAMDGMLRDPDGSETDGMLRDPDARETDGMSGGADMKFAPVNEGLRRSGARLKAFPSIFKYRPHIRTLAAVLINQLILGLIVNSLWISILYGSPYLPLLSTRIIQCAILIPVQFAGITAIRQAMLLRIKRAVQ